MYSSKQELIDAVIQSLPKTKQQDIFKSFSKRFLNTASLVDLNDRGTEELTCLMEELWNFTSTRDSSETKVRVYNPKNHSTHTVIQVICKDMPFLVDSVRMEINRYGLLVHFIVHLGSLLTTRNSKQEMVEIHSVGAYDENASSEAIMHIEIDRQSDEVLMKEMELSIVRVLNDVRACVEDWLGMRQKLHQALMELERNNLPLDPSEVAESRDFLRWLDSDHFTFLGFREYESVGEGKDRALKIVPSSGLGVLRDSSHSKVLRNFSDMPSEARNQILSSQILIIAKTNTRSSVHRPVYTDYVGVKRFNDRGEMVGELRFIGLYTSVAYSSNPKHIPFLRHKVSRVMQLSNLSPNGHAGKALLHIIETLPRDDLFQATPDELLEISMGILHLQERQRVRLFVRKDYYGRFYSCYVYVPRERFNTDLRKKLQVILDTRLNSLETTFTTRFSDSVLARIHFTVRIDPKNQVTLDVPMLERELVEASRSWGDNLYDYLVERYGEAEGIIYFNKYKDAFPAGYREYYNPYTACKDIHSIGELSEEKTLNMAFYRSVFKGNNVLRLKLFNLNSTMPLSDVLPLLENMGLRVIAERPNEILVAGYSVWINDCDLIYTDDESLNVESARENFQQAFIDIWNGVSENDAFNRLVLKAQLNCREVMLLRAYAKYLQQIKFTYSQSYIEGTLDKHANITKLLVELFHARFNPLKHIEDQGPLVTQIHDALDSVSVLDEDKILRRYVDLIMATLRTNFYQAKDDRLKPYVSFKFSPELIPEMPLPKPMYEIFVYSPRVEGVHLRSSKVARGGLRWSDRREDFRVEVLGLMKAQQVKNSVIVPSGAKGGFYPKNLPTGDRDAIFHEGKECYKVFIRGLLDITDNMQKGKVIPPKDVVVYDEDDTYLVVAADKGTATFSDTANALSEEYGFWLGDAFASGGSVGYDHKKMGITAKGAWESVKRHFRGNFNFNTQEEEFTVVGVGDMSGDVFGNGMLLSDKIRLVAAFNHMHIFIDPNPDAASGFMERKRLFELPRSSWADYNSELISNGGGIFSRSEKLITLTPEIKICFDIEEDALVPTDLIKAILKSKVDLLWNGGIGTYVKSSSESNVDVGDRVNDAVRVNGNELRCKVVGEGGNLGFTQLGRIEYSLNKGIIYTDFVDNSAGVDCSDHEVNIKILLNTLLENKKLNLEKRNALLAEMGSNVSQIVLQHNYCQTQAISFSEVRSSRSIDTYRRVIRRMEKIGKLDRELEFLPSNKTLTERKAQKLGLTNPEISVLYSYSKNILKEEILNSSIPEEKSFTDYLVSGFPQILQKKYFSYMCEHPLRREIISTQLANHFINRMGVNFIERVVRQTGASMPDIARAFVLSCRIFNMNELWDQINELDYQVDSHVQFEMLNHAYHLMRRSIRWFLKNNRKGIDVEHAYEYYSKPVSEFKQNLPQLLKGRDLEKFESIISHYKNQKIDDNVAQTSALTAVLFSTLDVVTAAIEHKISSKSITEVSYMLSVEFELDWLRRNVASKEIENLWDETMRYNLLDDLDAVQRNLAINIINMKPPRDSLDSQFDDWRLLNEDMLIRWRGIMDDLKAADIPEFTMFAVALKILQDITQATI